MNLYEITDIKTGKTIEPAVTLKQAAERLKCSRSAVSGACTAHAEGTGRES